LKGINVGVVVDDYGYGLIWLSLLARFDEDGREVPILVRFDLQYFFSVLRVVGEFCRFHLACHLHVVNTITNSHVPTNNVARLHGRR